jgi:hypothetical protein
MVVHEFVTTVIKIDMFFPESVMFVYESTTMDLQVPEKLCGQVPVQKPVEQCQNVPKQQCQQVPIQVIRGSYFIEYHLVGRKLWIKTLYRIFPGPREVFKVLGGG